jgi:hypothetical protein
MKSPLLKHILIASRELSKASELASIESQKQIIDRLWNELNNLRALVEYNVRPE